MHSTQRISFHESSLVSSRYVGRTLALELEGVHVEDDTRDVSIRLEGVSTILRDGTQVESFTEECEDGEILTLEYTEASMYLIVEWTDFKSHTSETHSYRFACDSVSVEIR
jgi:hypothetical protein